MITKNLAYEYIEDYLPLMSKYVIDIGALSIKNQNSNTKPFIDVDCRTLLVEPNPSQIAILEEETKDYPFVSVLPVAITNYNGIVEFYDSPTKGHSRIPNENFDRDKPTSPKKVRKLRVECWTMGKLFDHYPEYIDADFIDIDVEGNDEIVLESLFKTKCQPLFTLIEHQGNSDRIYRQEEMLIKKGYEFCIDVGISKLWKRI